MVKVVERVNVGVRVVEGVSVGVRVVEGWTPESHPAVL